MAVDDTWRITLPLAEDWLPLPLAPDDDVADWSRRQAAALGGGDTFARELRERAADSRSRAPALAFALCREGLDTVLAQLEVDTIHPDESVPDLTLDWIADMFSATDFGEPEVVRAKVPAGPAVRIRQALIGRGPGPHGDRPVLETVAYGVLPPGVGSAVMLLVSWTTPGLTDLMTEAADTIVGALTVGDGT